MATRRIDSGTLTAIADAIRAKTGGSSAMTPAQMAAEIGNISGGGSLDVARIVPGTYVGCTVDSDGKITSTETFGATTFPLTKGISVETGDVIRIAILGVARAYHQWTLYDENGTQLQSSQTANFTAPYFTSITAEFTGTVHSFTLRENPAGTFTDVKFVWFIDNNLVLA